MKKSKRVEKAMVELKRVAAEQRKLDTRRMRAEKVIVAEQQRMAVALAKCGGAKKKKKRKRKAAKKTRATRRAKR